MMGLTYFLTCFTVCALGSEALSLYHPWHLKESKFNIEGNLLEVLSGSKLHNVYESSNNVFPYFDTSIARQYRTFGPEYEIVNNVLLEDICNSDIHRYYSGNLFQKEFFAVHSILHPNKVFQENVDGKVSVNLWIGSAEVKATTHYDNANNIYVQLSGSKLFRLYPPKGANELLLYGRHHPYTCQSRIEDLNTCNRFHRQELDVLSDIRLKYNLTGPEDSYCDIIDSSSSCGNIQNDSNCNVASVLEVILNPGDVLFIPAFWFHEAAALTCSMSASYWWDAAVLDIMDDVYSLPLPIDSDWSQLKKTATIFLFLQRLIAGLEEALMDRLSDVDHQLSLIQLLSNRYESDRESFESALKTGHSSASVFIGQVMEQMIILSDDEPLLEKIVSLVQQSYLPLFKKFLISNEPDFSQILKSIRYEEVLANARFIGASDSERDLLNSAAIMFIKAGDYLEDVILYLASNNENSSTNLSESVLLFLEYLHIVEKNTVKYVH